MKNETGWRIAVVVATISVALVSAALGGCGRKASADQGSAKSARYECEDLDDGYYAITLIVVNDTETGESWLVAACADGGVAIERMTTAAEDGASPDEGE